MTSLEDETEKLREENEQLHKAKEDLSHKCRRLQAFIEHVQKQEAAREETAQAKARVQEEQHISEVMALEARLVDSEKEASKHHQQLLKMRQELGILRAARDFYKNRAAGPTLKLTGGIASKISNKVKFKKAQLRGRRHQGSHRTLSPNQAISWQGRSPSPTKDEWEDISVDR